MDTPKPRRFELWKIVAAFIAGWILIQVGLHFIQRNRAEEIVRELCRDNPDAKYVWDIECEPYRR